MAVFFLAGQAFLVIAPFLYPPGGKGDTSLPYWLYPVVGIVILICGVVYWFLWRKVVPVMGGFQWEKQKVALEDGTVVTRFERIKNS